MNRDIIDYANRGVKLPLGRAYLTASELNTLAQIAFKGDVSKAIIYAFHAGACIGWGKGKQHATRSTDCKRGNT